MNFSDCGILVSIKKIKFNTLSRIRSLTLVITALQKLAVYSLSIVHKGKIAQSCNWTRTVLSWT